MLQNAPGADPFLLNFHFLIEKLAGEHKARLAKQIVRESQAIKLVLGFEQDAKKLDRVLGTSKAELPSQVYSLLSPHPQPLLLYLLANTKSAKVQNRIKSYLFKFPEIQARLPRAELQSMGVKAGPEFDRILSKVFALQLDGKIKSHSQLMKELHELAGIEEPPPPPPPPVHPPKKGKETGSPAAHKKGRESAAASSASHPHKGHEATASAPNRPAAAGKPVAKGGPKPGAPAPPPAAPLPAARATPRIGRKLRRH